MSTSINIPKRKKSSNTQQEPSSSSSSTSHLSSTPPHTPSDPQEPSSSSSPVTPFPRSANPVNDRRRSLLSSSLSAQSHTVINVGHPDTPRLITFLTSSQGFSWNQEIFLPSHIPSGTMGLDRRSDSEKVHEIRLGDEDEDGR